MDEQTHLGLAALCSELLCRTLLRDLCVYHVKHTHTHTQTKTNKQTHTRTHKQTLLLLNLPTVKQAHRMIESRTFFLVVVNALSFETQPAILT